MEEIEPRQSGYLAHRGFQPTIRAGLNEPLANALERDLKQQITSYIGLRRLDIKNETIDGVAEWPTPRSAVETTERRTHIDRFDDENDVGLDARFLHDTEVSLCSRSHLQRLQPPTTSNLTTPNEDPS